jgi:pseudouridine kinase
VDSVIIRGLTIRFPLLGDLDIQSPDAPVLVIGAAGVDIVGRLKGDLHLETSNPSHIRSSFGGVARNVAENLARLGHPVTLLTAVGQDQAGGQLLEQLSTVGVDTHAILKVSDRPTGVYLAIVNERGELQVALDDMRIISAITPEYLGKQMYLFDKASLLFVDANLSKEALRKAITLAHKRRIPVAADPTAATLAHRLNPFLAKLTMVTPNIPEAGVLCDRTIEASRRKEAMEAAKCLVAHGVKLAVVTLAQFGVCYATSETSGYVPAIQTEIIDPTGAGDALTAAIIFALLNNIPLDDAIRLGVSAAALTLHCSSAVAPDLTLEKLYNQLVI